MLLSLFFCSLYNNNIIIIMVIIITIIIMVIIITIIIIIYYKYPSTNYSSHYSAEMGHSGSVLSFMFDN